MGLWKKVAGQFIDVIEWDDAAKDLMVWKFPRYDNEIKNGAQLIVRESQSAVFLHEGQLGDVFNAGRYELTTENIPILTTLSSWKYAFDAPFKCDVFFVALRRFTDLKWGTQNPIMLRDPEFGPVRLRAFGTYVVRVTDPGQFIKQIAGITTEYRTDEIINQFRDILVSRFADALGEAKVPILDLASNYNELGDQLREKIQPEFETYGVELTKLLVENISLPPEVEQALDKRSSMGVIGNMNTFTQYQTANAIEDMANNEGGAGGNMMGMFAGVGMGNVMGSTMQNNAQAPQQPGATPPPLPTEAAWYAGIEGQQVGPFDEKAFAQQVQSGRITRETLIWKQGMSGWVAAGNIPELASLFAAPPPLPPQ
jgi:membrane protease subunit (stomatin/prohibitin family)